MQGLAGDFGLDADRRVTLSERGTELAVGGRELGARPVFRSESEDGAFCR